MKLTQQSISFAQKKSVPKTMDRQSRIPASKPFAVVLVNLPHLPMRLGKKFRN
jgi:hypothetical protein